MLVRPIVDDTRETEHGLLLPATEEKEQKARGIVEARGNEASADLTNGTEVIYGAYAGENLKTQDGGKDVTYKLLLDEDIIAFIR